MQLWLVILLTTFGQHNVWLLKLWPCHLVNRHFVNTINSRCSYGMSFFLQTFGQHNVWLLKLWICQLIDRYFVNTKVVDEDVTMSFGWQTFCQQTSRAPCLVGTSLILLWGQETFGNLVDTTKNLSYGW